MTKAEKAKFNLLLKEIESLKKELESVKCNKDTWYKRAGDFEREINSIHAALDVLPGIPGKKVKLTEYQDVELTINARLFAWVSSVAFGKRIKPQIEEE